MLQAAQEAITDRLKTPIQGTFLLFFIWFNYPTIQSLIINFNDSTMTEILYKDAYFKFKIPIYWTLGYIMISALVKIANENLNILITRISDSLSDWLSKAQWNKNIKLINEYRDKEKILMINITDMERYCNIIDSKSTASLNQFKSDSISANSKQNSHTLPNAIFNKIKTENEQIKSHSSSIKNLINDTKEKVLNNSYYDYSN